MDESEINGGKNLGVQAKSKDSLDFIVDSVSYAIFHFNT